METMESHSVAALKSQLKRWKESRDMVNGGARLQSGHSEESDSGELEPAQLISDEVLVPVNKKRVSVDLESLLMEFKRRKPKVEIRTDAVQLAAKEVDAQTEQLRCRMEVENEHGKGRIKRAPPGIDWLCQHSTDKRLSLSALPLVDPSLCISESEMTMLRCVRCPFKAVGLVKSLTVIKLTHKNCLLNNMFLAMCLHSQSSVIRSLNHCLTTILTSTYKGVDYDLDSWSPRFDDIMTAIQALGAGDVGYEECDNTDSRSNTESQTIANIANIKALLSIITCACTHRKHLHRQMTVIDSLERLYKWNILTNFEVIELLTVIAKLSLDKSLICAGLLTDLQSSVNALLSVPVDEDDTEDEGNGEDGDCSLYTYFSDMELELCRRLLSLVKHHHNTLHILRTIPSLSERTLSFRMTLAYLAIRQLVSNSDPASTQWSMRSLADEYFSVEINEAADMYLLYSLITLFDLAVGSEVHQNEREDLNAMKDDLSTFCRSLKENPMRPDITKTKSLMHRISLRWDWLVRKVTPMEVRLDIKHKPTPTKIIQVDSQEVHSADDASEDMDTASTATSHNSGTDEKKVTDKGKRPLNPNKVPIVKTSSPSPIQTCKVGLEKIRMAAREYIASGGSSPSRSGSNTPSTSISITATPSLSDVSQECVPPNSQTLKVSPISSANIRTINIQANNKMREPNFGQTPTLTFATSSAYEMGVVETDAMETDDDLPDLLD